jgi:acetyl esterase
MQMQPMNTNLSAPFGDVDERDLVYRSEGSVDWLARVYTPRGPGPFPALLDVHGGAWSGGDRTADAYLDRTIAAAGFVVVAIDFRLAPEHPYPASIIDVNYATRWLKVRAPALNALPDQIGALGTSSGGHMAVLSALRPADPRYAAILLEPLTSPAPSSPAGADESPSDDASLAYVVACWPPIDPIARYRFARETGRTDLVARTESYFRTDAAMQEGNPQVLLERGEAMALPPILVVQGTDDGNIPLPMIERFASSYRAAGGAIELALFEGQPHGFANRPGPETDRAIALIISFLRRQTAR